MARNNSRTDYQLHDEGERTDDHKHLWAIFLDNAYQDVENFLFGIELIKKSIRRVLKASENSLNQDVSSHRIIVELI